ncbi:MAG TPA: dihydrofolate reductase [Chloroflexota bacterium]|nr:dihydrofolate reductase [Chloroflexota bacterium]
MIAAMDQNRVIGAKGGIPWRLPDDLKRLRRLTTGSTVVMGRKTYESIGKALPNRRNVIVTRQPGFVAEGCEVVGSMEEALVGDVWVLGGGEIYAQALPRADRMELTFVDTAVSDGDTWFPEWDERDWREVRREHHAADERHAFAFDFVTFERATS